MTSHPRARRRVTAHRIGARRPIYDRVQGRHRRFLARQAWRRRHGGSVVQVEQVIRRSVRGAQGSLSINALYLTLRPQLHIDQRIVSAAASPRPVHEVSVRERLLHTRLRVATLVRERERMVVRHTAATLAVHMAPPQPAEARPAVRPSAYPRVAMTLTRTQSPAATTAAASAESERERRTAVTAGFTDRRGASALSAALPAQELARVTEHVLRTLDRRVLSYRERTGQI